MYIDALAERKKANDNKKTGSQLALERARAMIDSAQSTQTGQGMQTKSMAFAESMNGGRSAIVPEELSPMARLRGAADLSTQRQNIPASSTSGKKPVTSVVDADYYDTWRQERDRATEVTVGGKSVLPTAKEREPETRDRAENIAYNVGAWLAPENADSGNILNNLRYPIARLVAGALGFGEGVTDFAGSLINDVLSEGAHMLGLHSVGDWFAEGSDYTRENNMTAAFSQGIADKTGEVSKLQGIAGDIYEGAGQLIPNILTGKALGGAASIAGDKVSKALVGLSSAGNATQEAYDEGADSGQATAYGAASGLLEVAIESIAGGIPGLGKGATGKLMDKLKNSPATLKLLVDILGEGGEEALSTYLTPALKRMTYDPDAENASAEEIIRSAAMGSALSAITQSGNLPASIAEDVNALRSRGQNAKTAPAGAEAGGSADVEAKNAFNGEAENVDANSNTTAAAEPTLVNKLQSALPQLSMSPVGARITGMELQNGGGKATDRAMSFIESIGGKVNRPGFGDVFFSRSKVKSSLVGHGVSDAKIDLFAAVPSVIENGTQIEHVENWKGRGYDTYIFAAPVNYKGARTYLGTIVVKDAQSGRYYLHEAIDENGSVLYKERTPSDGSDRPVGISPSTDTVTPNEVFREAETSSQVNPRLNELSGSINEPSSASENSIFSSPEKVNSNFSQGGELPASIAEDVNALRSRGQNAKTAPAGVRADTDLSIKNTPLADAGDAVAAEVSNATPNTTSTLRDAVGVQGADGVVPQISAEQKRRPTIVNQLKNAIPQMQDMQPVANVTGNEIKAESAVVERLMNFVSSIGGKVSRNGFGDVIFSRTKIKNGIIGHGAGRSKIETFAAVPAVIKYGTQIDYVENYMGRGYDTYVFAAPINYKNNTSYLGVVVTKDARDGRYYVHEVVDGNGNLIFVDKENQETPISRRQDVPGHPDPEASPDSRDVVRQAGLPDTFDTVSASAIDSNLPQGMKSVNSNLPRNIGAKEADFGYAEKVNQQHSTQSALTEQERQMLGLREEDFTHQVKTDAEAMAKAKERLDFDFEGEMESLREMADWDKDDTTAAHLILRELIEQARDGGDYSRAVEWNRTLTAHQSGRYYFHEVIDEKGGIFNNKKTVKCLPAGSPICLSTRTL